MYIISLPVTNFSLHSICGINAPWLERNSLCDSKQKQSILTFWSPNDLRSTFASQSGETLHNGVKGCFSGSPESPREHGQAPAGSQPDTSPKAILLTLRPLRDFQRWKPRQRVPLCHGMIEKHPTLHASFTTVVDQWPANTRPEPDQQTPDQTLLLSSKWAHTKLA